MPDVREFQKVVEAAENAAAAGDIAAAEALLREAAELQEASHGPLHPDLASTFNNLAVVCEKAHKPIDAEQFYRRAYAIASWSLSPGHPMVATARDNLRDFCMARGLPIEEWMDMRTGAHIAPPMPAGPPAPAALAAAAPALAAPALAAPAPPPTLRVPPPAPPLPPSPAASSAAAMPPRASRPPVSAASTPAARRPRRSVGVAVAVVAVLAVVAIARMSRAPSSDAEAPLNAAQNIAPPVRDAAPEPAPVAAAPAPAPATVAPPVTAITPAPAAAVPTPPAAPAPASPRDADTPAGVRVVTATICTALTTGDAWRCTAAGAAPGPGRLSYYTRVASPRGLRVQHRWYQGDRLRQDVALTLGANAVDGYRTFSRQTVAPGEWRVELRAENGAMLDEARFVVR